MNLLKVDVVLTTWGHCELLLVRKELSSLLEILEGSHKVDHYSVSDLDKNCEPEDFGMERDENRKWLRRGTVEVQDDNGKRRRLIQPCLEKES